MEQAIRSGHPDALPAKYLDMMYSNLSFLGVRDLLDFFEVFLREPDRDRRLDLDLDLSLLTLRD